MQSQDRRVRRTQHLLAKALIALTLEKGYDAVTIRDITERADVGYATFFRHYHDKDELLKDVLDVVLTELIDLLVPTLQSTDSTTLGVLLFHYVQQHSEVVRVLLERNALLQKIIKVTSQDVINKNTPLPGSAVPIEIAAYLIVTSSVALIRWWLDEQMPYSPERMGAIYHELIIKPTGAVAFSPPAVEEQTQAEI